jgi:hypothetical protein
MRPDSCGMAPRSSSRYEGEERDESAGPASGSLVLELELDPHRFIERHDQGRVARGPVVRYQEHPVLALDEQPESPIPIVVRLIRGISRPEQGPGPVRSYKVTAYGTPLVG